MDQNKIGNYIKELRLKNNLSQSDLAKKLSVTNQAISKWENGRGIPDVEMLKKLSIIFNVNVDDILNGEEQLPKKNTKKQILLSLGIIIFIIAFIILVTNASKKDNFKFNSIASDNNNFAIKGVIAYNKNKKSIYISDIKYSAADDNQEEYVVAECILYEIDGNNEKKISQCGDINSHKEFDKKEAKTLSTLLKDVEFNIDNYSCTCEKENCNNLFLKVNAIDINNKTITYNIPIQIDNSCIK